MTADRWTGGINLNVHDRRDWTVGVLQFVVGADEVIVSYGEEQVDAIDRGRIMKWLAQPHDSLHEIATTWTVTGNVLVVQVLPRAGLALVVLSAEIELLRQAIIGSAT